MQTLFNILTFVLVIGTIILVHEVGHFIAAKGFGIFCSNFSIGMGPAIFKFKKGETTYSIGLLPIGGFVSMAGEADQEDNELMKDLPIERTLKGIGAFKKVIIMGAGAAMNFLLAIIIFISLNIVNGSISTNSNIIGSVVKDSSAEVIGIKAGDEIKQITFVETDKTFIISNMNDLHEALNKENNIATLENTSVIVEIKRANQVLELEGQVTLNDAKTSFYLGVMSQTRDLTLMESINYGTKSFMDMSTMIFRTLRMLVTDSKNVLPQLSGPVGIYQVTSEVAKTGDFTNILMLIALLSVNVGIFNLLPIPGLDGSQIIIAVAEKVVGRELPTKFKYYLQLSGVIFVLGLMIIVIFNDIIKLF
jgi:Predicted membrane-associated Zn-dependent proteases 1